MNTDTQWGSVATMVEYGLENRAAINIYCKKQSVLSYDTLLKEDWIKLEKVFLTMKYIDNVDSSNLI
jgi:hypothetical protein